ncbi:MAG: DNA-binding domain-containing protein [Labilithrix sp.]
MSGAPGWLADFQAQFGAMLRTPLDRTTGHLRVETGRYPTELVRLVPAVTKVSGDQRLATYNRQYWYRLFGLLAAAFPLTARLVGHWRFNEHAASFLAAHPPRSYLIDHVADGFAEFFAKTVRPAHLRGLRLEPAALVEAVHIDDAWRVVHAVALPSVWRLGPSDAPRVLTSRLRPSPVVRLIEESWPLVDLRGQVVDDDGESPVALPAPRRKAWAIVRRPNGVGALPLEPLEAVLFGLLRDRSVADALSELEARCPPEDRGSLPERARSWLMRSVELGFWLGLDDATARPQK